MDRLRNRFLFVAASAMVSLAGCQSSGKVRDASGASVVPGAQSPGKEQVYVELAAAYLQEGQIGVALFRNATALVEPPSGRRTN